MRLDDLYLVDLIEAREEIDRMMAGASFREFKVNKSLSTAAETLLADHFVDTYERLQRHRAGEDEESA